MRPHVHSERERQAHGAFHGGFVAGVAAASDVGGGDLFHEARLERQVVQLSEVAIEIADHSECSHRSLARNASSACSMVTDSKATGARGRNCPSRQKSAEMTFAGFG